MNTFSSYPSYKPSGLHWLGEIPSHWELRRLKFISSVTYSNVDKHTKEGEIPVRLCNYVDVYKNDHITNDLEFMEATAGSSEIIKFGLLKGDVIITKDSEDWKDIAVPAFVPENLDGVICGYHLALIRPYPNQVDGEYLFRAFRAPAINYQFQVAASGITRYGLGKQALGDAWILLPPIEEQRIISAYLNQETEHIDALIAKKGELIDLLDKKRASIISHAVTKGLNPKARMKPSGVEWLGDIPEHWNPCRLRFNLNRNDGGVWGDEPEEGDETATIVLRSTEINLDGTWNMSNPARRKLSETEIQKYLLIKDDLLITKSSGSEQHLGKAAIVTQEIEDARCCFSNFMQRLRVTKENHSKYLFYLLNCDVGKEQLGYWGSTTTGLRNLTASVFSEVYMPGAPRSEQEKIVKFLDERVQEINDMVKSIEKSIRLLETRRTALISAAVTGKIDVRKQGN